MSAVALILCCSMSGHHLSMGQAFALTQHQPFNKNGLQQQQHQQPINQFDRTQHRLLHHNLVAKSSSNSRRQSTRMSLVPAGLGYIASSYNNALTVFPTITKAATGFFLCGAGDVLAQYRGMRDTDDKKEGGVVVEKKKFDWKRLLKFAGKGTLGTLIWAAWYDLSDVIVANIVRGASMNFIQLQVYKTVLLLSLEQFLACPTVFGLWEIPASTLLNVGPFNLSFKQVGYEIKSKLGDMLIENAKVWTLVNILIYNVPVQFRAPLGNIMDIVWQSIVSDFAADCGTTDETTADDAVQESSNTGVVPLPSSSQP